MEKIKFNNTIFSQFSSGYYFGHVNGKFKGLHVAVWEYHTGKIVPRGYEIHHKDYNRLNNYFENLECLPVSVHRSIHPRDPSSYVESLKRAVEAAKDWHKSDIGRSWHKKQSKKNWERLRENPIIVECELCGKRFEALLSSRMFCSPRCQQRANAVTYRNCTVCGSEFKTNKYKLAKTCSRSCANKHRSLKQKPN